MKKFIQTILALVITTAIAHAAHNENSPAVKYATRILVANADKAPPQFQTTLGDALKQPAVAEAIDQLDKARTHYMGHRGDQTARANYAAAAKNAARALAQYIVQQNPDFARNISAEYLPDSVQKSGAQQAAAPKKAAAKPAASPRASSAINTSTLRFLTPQVWNPAGLTLDEAQKMTAALEKATQQPDVIAVIADLTVARKAYQENQRKFPKERDPAVSTAYRKAGKQAADALRAAMIAADPATKPLFEKSLKTPKRQRNEGENATDSDTGNKAAMAPVTDDPKLPRVLLIGDSISIGYTVQVRQKLAGIANVHRVPVNAGATEVGIANIDAWLGNKKWDAIHFNFGLHDAKYASRTEQRATRDQYIANLQSLIDTMRKHGAKHLVFATTTPIPEMLKYGVATGGRVFDSIEARNELAIELMKKNNVAIDDLYTLVKNNPGTGRDHDVHFTLEGYELLSTAVADSIKKELQK